MNTQNLIQTRQLAPRAAQVLTDAAGTEVLCHSGCVWITQYGDSRDRVLKPGQSCVLDLPTVVVMSSQHGALIGLRPGVPAVRRGWWQRLAGWFDPRSGSAVNRELSGRLAQLQAQAGARGMRPL
jgi:hypothetical protein